MYNHVAQKFLFYVSCISYSAADEWGKYLSNGGRRGEMGGIHIGVKRLGFGVWMGLGLGFGRVHMEPKSGLSPCSIQGPYTD